MALLVLVDSPDRPLEWVHVRCTRRLGSVAHFRYLPGVARCTQLTDPGRADPALGWPLRAALPPGSRVRIVERMRMGATDILAEPKLAADGVQARSQVWGWLSNRPSGQAAAVTPSDHQSGAWYPGVAELYRFARWRERTRSQKRSLRHPDTNAAASAARRRGTNPSSRSSPMPAAASSGSAASTWAMNLLCA
jgi:hypothetical protein